MITMALEEKKRFRNIFDTRKYNKEFAINNPNYFYPSGFICMVGVQGGGKTLVAVNYVYWIMEHFPKCLLVTNIDLKDYPVDNTKVFRFESANDLLKYKNGKEGVLFFIDEVHLYLGSQKGANNINPEVMQTICQQRKQRIHIVSTTQFFAQLNINLRRHFDTIVLCESKKGGLQQKVSVIDRDSIDSKESSDQKLEGEVKFTYTYWRSPEMFERYDTYAVINSNLSVGVEREVSNYDNTDTRLSNSIKLLDSHLKSIVADSTNNVNR